MSYVNFKSNLLTLYVKYLSKKVSICISLK